MYIRFQIRFINWCFLITVFRLGVLYNFGMNMVFSVLEMYGCHVIKFIKRMCDKITCKRKNGFQRHTEINNYQKQNSKVSYVLNRFHLFYLLFFSFYGFETMEITRLKKCVQWSSKVRLLQ